MSRKHFTRDAWEQTNLVVLDGKEHEAMRVLPQQWLISLFRLDGRRDWKFLLGLDDFRDGFLELEVVEVFKAGLHILLSSRFEA